jgi:hypothetical protein
MENTVRLSDEKLEELATKAVKLFFDDDVVGASALVVRHWPKAYDEITDVDDDMNTSIWFVHGGHPEFDPDSITNANIELLENMKVLGDARRISLFHGYVDPAKPVDQAA